MSATESWVIGALLTLSLVGIAIALAYSFASPRRRARGLGRMRRRAALIALTSAGMGAALALLVSLDFEKGLKAAVAPADAYVIEAIVGEGSCSFGYPTGFSVQDRLVLPAGRRVRLDLTSVDRPSSMAIPALGISTAVDPRHYNSIWFDARDEGVFAMACAGSTEGTPAVRVLEASAFEDWVDRGGDDTLSDAEYGRRLFGKLACGSCHSMDGSASIGPPLAGVLGRTEKLVGGSKIVVDTAYLRESITTPTAKVAFGFPPVMPSLPSSTTRRQIDAIVSFLSTAPTANKQLE